jgi:hypothetical protein
MADLDKVAVRSRLEAMLAELHPDGPKAAIRERLEAMLRDLQDDPPGSVRVGVFVYSDGEVRGPAAYMLERGNARLETIQAGRDTVVNHALRRGAEPAAAVLTSMQTDYAAWLGTRPGGMAQ